MSDNSASPSSLQKKLAFYAAVLPIVVNAGTVAYFFGRQASTIEQMALTVKEVKDFSQSTDNRLRALEIKAAAMAMAGSK